MRDLIKVNFGCNIYTTIKVDVNVFDENLRYNSFCLQRNSDVLATIGFNRSPDVYFETTIFQIINIRHFFWSGPAYSRKG